ncbi:DDE superfamily endonuclease [Phytophthora infestans]|uniref:DDE superfamily endonuclease n=1 Tax=Phytophthora infestans TaxID=4787 RepID=A0A833TGA5_PHYIN|nr:DDE superfamily endonuclease [Phytophthora infestans]
MTALFNGEDSDADESDDHFTAIYRYLSRSSVLKTAQWSPRLIVLMDPMRAPRNLRMSRNTFVFLLRRIEADPAFARVPAKQQQAPIQLQLEVFLLLYSRCRSIGSPSTSVSRKALCTNLEIVLSAQCWLWRENSFAGQIKGKGSKPRNKTFNWLLAQQRIVIEHTIGVMKARFSILDAIRERVQNDNDVESVSKRIVSCFIIHNVCIDCDDTFDVSIAPTTDDDLQADEDVEVVDWSTEDSEDLRTRPVVADPKYAVAVIGAALSIPALFAGDNPVVAVAVDAFAALVASAGSAGVAVHGTSSSPGPHR